MDTAQHSLPSDPPATPPVPHSVPSQKKNKFILLGIVVGLVLLLGVVWWFLQPSRISPQDNQQLASGKVMKVARYYWPGMYWVEIADKKGWFREAGLNVELIDTNADYYASLKDVSAGKLDTQAFFLFDLLQENINGSDLVMVLNSDTSFGNDGIVTKNTITNAAQLKGKKIGVSKGTTHDYILDIYLTRNSFTKQDITLVDIPVEKTVEAFGKGEIDGYVAYEPYISEGITKYKGRKLFDTSNLPGIAPGGFAFSKSFIDSNEEQVQAFVKTWHRTTEYIKQNPQESYTIIAKIYNKDVSEIEEYTKTNKILDLRENLTAFSYAAGFESLHGSIRQANEYFINEKITDQRLDSVKILDARFIRALDQNQP